MKLVLTLWACLWILPPAHAEFNLTSGLNSAQRNDTLEVLGFGTQFKNLFRPSPLGSNSGFQVSLSAEMISTSNISEFIVEETNRDSVLYPKIYIGKGIYERLDAFFHFTPFTQTLGFSEYGGFVRYHLTQPGRGPVFTSLVIHGNTGNFNNQLNINNTGANISMGLQFQHFSLSGVVGFVRSEGRFVGGAQGVTDTLNTENNSKSSEHVGLGAHYSWKTVVASVSLDHYTAPVISLKLGMEL